MPARFTAEMCTNTSGPPSAGRIKPKPFWLLKNLTVPSAIDSSFATLVGGATAAPPSVRIQRCLGNPERQATRQAKSRTPGQIIWQRRCDKCQQNFREAVLPERGK